MEDPEEVSTEPQRRALEEMSQALLARLDEMLAEQHRRSTEFAERTHSLSHLPELTSPVKPGESAPERGSAAYDPRSEQKSQESLSGEAFGVHPTPPPVAKSAASSRKVAPPPASSIQKAVKKAESYINDSGWNGGFAQSYKSSPQKPKDQESSFGVGAVVFVIFVILFFLRACQ